MYSLNGFKNINSLISIMTGVERVNTTSLKYRILTNQLGYYNAQTSEEKRAIARIIQERKENYRNSGKHYNYLVKMHNRQRNNYDKAKTPMHERNYLYEEYI